MPVRNLDDETPLDGDRIDVAVRVGWLLRMARLGAAGTAPLGLADLAQRLGTNTTRLHRAETGQVRSGTLLNGYEQALGLPAESLRAPADVLCRGFAYAPPDREPGEPPSSVREVSALTERVGSGEADGAAWLAWARALARPGAVGLPEDLGRRLALRLASELSRAAGSAYPSRYQALSLLRDSGYGHLVLEAARERAAEPHVQVLYDVMSAVGEARTPDAVAWCLDLLRQDRPKLVVGGALCLENMAEVSGDPDFWVDLVGPLIDVLDDHDTGTAQHEWVSHLLRLVPRRVLTAVGRRPRVPLATAAQMPDWSRTQLNRHWAECQTRAAAVTDALDLPEQPVLARLLFDVAMGPHESRAVTGYLLLGALPALRRTVGAHVAELAAEHPDPVIRDRSGRRLSGFQHGDWGDLPQRWLREGTTEDRERACHIAGAAGLVLPDALLRELAASDSWPAALYAAGMAGHPRLPDLAADPALPAEVSGAARWWLREGVRVVDRWPVGGCD